jgi:hypothetical protein
VADNDNLKEKVIETLNKATQPQLSGVEITFSKKPKVNS